MSKQHMHLYISKDDPDVAYLALPNHPGRGLAGIVCRQVSVRELVDGYKGPELYLDFDAKGVVIGIEILA